MCYNLKYWRPETVYLLYVQVHGGSICWMAQINVHRNAQNNDSISVLIYLFENNSKPFFATAYKNIENRFTNRFGDDKMALPAKWLKNRIGNVGLGGEKKTLARKIAKTSFLFASNIYYEENVLRKFVLRCKYSALNKYPADWLAGSLDCRRHGKWTVR